MGKKQSAWFVLLGYRLRSTPIVCLSNEDEREGIKTSSKELQGFVPQEFDFYLRSSALLSRFKNGAQAQLAYGPRGWVSNQQRPSRCDETRSFNVLFE